MAPAFSVLHIFSQLRRGGPVNALRALVKRQRDASRFRHRILSLKPVDPVAARAAAAAGIPAACISAAEAVRAQIAAADIVQFHFWNNPDIHALLRGPLPQLRAVVWCHVNGSAPPHVVPRALFGFADRVVATSPRSLDLACFRDAPADRVACIAGGVDPDRLHGIGPAAHQGFVVGYVGVVDYAKLHPQFLTMSLSTGIADARFVVAGDGADRPALMRDAARAGAPERFEFLGFVPDIRRVLACFDVFGYPLCGDTYATSDLSLQEAMMAGVPPVVLPHGGAADLVADGETGIIAGGEHDYGVALASLRHDEGLRRRLGRNAACYARDHFDARIGAEKFERLYADLMVQPKRSRPAIGNERPGIPAGAAALIDSLDGNGDADFALSLTAPSEAEAAAADDRIAASSAGMAEFVLQYRLHYPADAFLRYWSGMVFARNGRHGLAAAEFAASLRLGGPAARAARALAAAKLASPGIIGNRPAA